MSSKAKLYRYGDEKTRNKFRYKTRHYSNVVDRVKEYILNNSDKRYVCKEEIGAELKVNASEVEHALHQLNLEGLVGQARHVGPPHDIFRQNIPGDIVHSGWQADEYTLNMKSYIVNYLKLNINNSFRQQIINATMNSSNAIIDHVLNNCKELSKKERNDMLKKISIDINYNYRHFNEYEGRDRAIVLSCISKNTPTCVNLLLKNNSININERKKIFKIILNSDVTQHIYTLIEYNFLIKSEKEKLIEKAFKKNDHNLLFKLNKYSLVKINKNIQDKLDGYLVMQQLLGNNIDYDRISDDF
jgi:hypothetical protein